MNFSLPKLSKFFLPGLLVLSACTGPAPSGTSGSSGTSQPSTPQGMEIRFLVGSDLKNFCEQSAQQLNATQPKLDSGQAFYLSCEAKGSGDVIQQVLSLIQQFQQGSIEATSPDFPTLISVDGEIYQNQFIYEVDKIFPGQNYIPGIADSPLIAYSPMVFMTQEDLALGLESVEDPYVALVNYQSHNELDDQAPPLPINFVHTAPTRSNSGLQTLVAQFSSVTGKNPEDLTIDDVTQNQEQVRQIQEKITRYGTSTGSLARSMVANGVFWASVGSVYESLVIEANSNLPAGQPRYKAVYPSKTFSSNIRAMLPQAPWVSDEEAEAATKVIEFMQLPETQAIAVDLGLRPGTPGVPLNNKFSSEFGVEANLTYDSLRVPDPTVVEAMLTSWSEYAKKPSQVVVVIDTSGSMEENNKLASVQNTLYSYLNNLGPKEKVTLISFGSEISDPVSVEGTPEGKQVGLEYVSQLNADGDTRLYDSALYARNWLRDNKQEGAINAVLVLTDGLDSGTGITLEQLNEELSQSGFNSDERIAFFTIGYGQAGSFNPDILQNIAEINGGYYKTGTPETIGQVMADLQVEF